MHKKNIGYAVSKISFYIILLTFLISGFTLPSKPNLKEIRDLYVQSVTSKTTNEILVNKLKEANESTPVLSGYKGAAFIIMAKHHLNPWKKWNDFKKGRDIVENVIKKYPENFELRFIRLSLQSNLPAILNYSSDMEEDSSILINAIPQIKDNDLKNRVIKYFEENDKP